MANIKQAFTGITILVKDFKLIHRYIQLEKEIDQLYCLAVRPIYQLYGLTEDEIMIVEENSNN